MSKSRTGQEGLGKNIKNIIYDKEYKGYKDIKDKWIESGTGWTGEEYEEYNIVL